MSNLPDGFVLDQPPNQQAAPALPDGFVIDHPSMWQDAVKSADAGIGKGLTTLLGLPGNVATFAHAVAPQGVTDAIKSVPGANWLYNHIPGRPCGRGSSCRAATVGKACPGWRTA